MRCMVGLPRFFLSPKVFNHILVIISDGIKAEFLKRIIKFIQQSSIILKIPAVFAVDKLALKISNRQQIGAVIEMKLQLGTPNYHATHPFAR